MTTGISSLILNAGEGETLFQASGEFWIWKATGETNNGQYDQAEVITLPQAGTPEHSRPPRRLHTGQGMHYLQL